MLYPLCIHSTGESNKITSTRVGGEKFVQYLLNIIIASKIMNIYLFNVLMINENISGTIEYYFASQFYK